MGIPVKLQAFEGPLDLLLHLIDKHKIDIYDIPVSLITDQYLEYIQQMREQKMDIASEFLVMAATLLELKSRMLLPKEEKPDEEEEETDPREELVKRLLEYKMVRYQADELRDRSVEASRNLYREQQLPEEVKTYEPPIDYEKLIGKATIESLEKTFQEVLRRQRNRVDTVRSGFGKIEREEYDVVGRERYIRERIAKADNLSFRALLEEQPGKEEIIVTFLVVLDMAKSGEIHLIQDDNFGEILIRPGMITPEEILRQQGLRPQKAGDTDTEKAGENDPAPAAEVNAASAENMEEAEEMTEEDISESEESIEEDISESKESIEEDISESEESIEEDISESEKPIEEDESESEELTGEDRFEEPAEEDDSEDTGTDFAAGVSAEPAAAAESDVITEPDAAEPAAAEPAAAEPDVAEPDVITEPDAVAEPYASVDDRPADVVEITEKVIPDMEAGESEEAESPEKHDSYMAMSSAAGLEHKVYFRLSTGSVNNMADTDAPSPEQNLVQQQDTPGSLLTDEVRSEDNDHNIEPVEIEAAEPAEIEAAEPAENETAEPAEIVSADPKEIEAEGPEDIEAAEPEEIEATEPEDNKEPEPEESPDSDKELWKKETSQQPLRRFYLQWAIRWRSARSRKRWRSRRTGPGRQWNHLTRDTGRTEAACRSIAMMTRYSCQQEQTSTNT